MKNMLQENQSLMLIAPKTVRDYSKENRTFRTYICFLIKGIRKKLTEKLKSRQKDSGTS
jgi:hypothetical protein